MADETVGIDITANASGMEAGSAEAVESVDQIGASVKTLVDAFLELGGAATGSFREIRTGAIEAGESVKGLAEGFVAMREAISGIGEALIAAFAVEQIAEFATKMGENAEENLHVAETFGITTAEVQRMKAMAAGSGIAFDAMTTAMARSSRAITQARDGSKQLSETFQKLGIDISQSINPADLLQRELTGLAQIPDTATKLGLAYQLFGRNIQAIVPLISQTKEQQAELNDEIDKSNAVNDRAEQSGLAVADANNQFKIAMQGLSNVMAEAFAPLLVPIVNGLTQMVEAFSQSYEKGGEAKVVMDEIAISLKAVVTAVLLLVVPLEVLAEVFMYFYDQLRSTALMMSGNWPAAEKVAEKSVTDLTDSLKQANTQLQFMHDLWMGNIKLPPLPKAAPAGDVTVKPPKEKKGKDDRVQQWQEQLDEMLMAEKNFFGDSTIQELLFWQTKLAATKEGSKDWLEVQKKIYADQKSLAKEQKDNALADIKEEEQFDAEGAREAAAKAQGVLAAKKEALDQAVALHQISAGQELAAELNLADQTTKAAKAAAEDEYTVQMDAIQKQLDLGTLSLTEEMALLNERRLLYEKLQDQLTDIERKGIADRQKLEDQAIQAQAQKAHQFIDPIVQAWGTGMLGMIEGTKTWQQALASIGDSVLSQFVGLIEKMVERWIVSEFVKTASTMAGNTARVTSTAAAAVSSAAVSKAANATTGANDAIMAAKGAYASASQVPVIGWVLAPIAAAAAFTAVEAFGSAEGGWDIPPGVNPLVQAHAEEMVLPARIANPIRDMVDSYTGSDEGSGAAGAGGRAGGGGDVYHIHAMDSRDVVRFFKKHGSAVLTGTNKGLRNNGQLVGATG